MLEELLAEAGELWWALAIYAFVVPIEMLSGTGHPARLAERLGNFVALLVNFTAGIILLSLALDQHLGLRALGYPDQPRWAVLANPVLYAVTVVFLVDGFYYVYHRLQHAVPLLWHIHKLHHTDPAVNITTAKRTHFLERPLQFFLLVAPALWVVGYNPAGMAYMAVIGPFFLYFAHVDVRLSLGPLTPVFVGPQYHRIHHGRTMQHQTSNFAQAFPLFDMLGGTYRRPDASEYGDTGIDGCETTRDRWRPLIW
jgi:sterol desaturase/sphingolipid hydroxylase (fatty acid hydroxylase superfamily)